MFDKTKSDDRPSQPRSKARIIIMVGLEAARGVSQMLGKPTSVGSQRYVLHQCTERRAKTADGWLSKQFILSLRHQDFWRTGSMYTAIITHSNEKYSEVCK